MTNYWNDRASGKLPGIKNKLLSALFPTGRVSLKQRRFEKNFVINNFFGWYILDAGAGNGRFMKAVDRYARGPIYGIDSSIEMVNRSPSNRVIHGDILDTHFADGHFCTVYAVRSIKNILDYDQQEDAIKELCRITTRLIIFDQFDGSYPAHNLPIIQGDIIGAAEDSGFKLVKDEYFKDNYVGFVFHAKERLMKKRHDKTKSELDTDAYSALISKGNNKPRKPSPHDMTPEEKVMVKEMNEGVK